MRRSAVRVRSLAPASPQVKGYMLFGLFSFAARRQIIARASAKESYRVIGKTLFPFCCLNDSAQASIIQIGH